MTKKKRSPLKWLIIAIVALLVILFIGKKAGWIGKEEGMKVTTENPMRRTIIQTVLANGKIQPELEVKISPEIPGEIIGLYVAVGDSVKKGKMLVKINPEMVQAAVDRARASVNNSMANLNNTRARLTQTEASFKNTELTFQRNERLYKDKVISEVEFLNSKTAYESAKSELEAAKQTVEGARYSLMSMQAGLKEAVENLSRTTIYSPIDGIVTQLNVALGERVVGTSQMQGTEMMRIADMRVIQARVDISESDILKVKIGDTSIIEVDAYPNRKFKGIVTEIANAATSATANFSEQVTNYSVKINLLPESYADLSAKLKNPFRPGLSASVEVITNRSENVISVPIASVTLRAVSDSGSVKTKEKLESEERRNNLREGKENADVAIDKDKFSEVIFVVENGVVKSIPVKTGIQDENYFEIKSVLSDSAQVITGPFTAISKELKGGEKVKVVKKEMLFGGK